MEYTIERELTQILGEIELQLGDLSKPEIGQTKITYFSGDIEKAITEKYSQLTDIQRYSVSEKLNIRWISTIH